MTKSTSNKTGIDLNKNRQAEGAPVIKKILPKGAKLIKQKPIDQADSVQEKQLAEGLNAKSPVYPQKQIEAKRVTLDKLQNRYNALQNDEVWTIDFTNVKTKSKSYWVALTIDLASKKVLIYAVKEGAGCPFMPKDVVNLVHEATLIRQKPKLVHTDQGGQFVAKEFTEYLAQASIGQSIGDQVYKKFPNQAHESANKTIKGLIKREIRTVAQMVRKPVNFNYLDEITDEQTRWIFNNAINNYNNNPHSGVFNATPNVAELVLAQAQQQKVFQKENLSKELVVYTTNSPEQKETKRKLAQIFQKYATEWIRNESLTEQKVQEIIAKFYEDVNFVMVALQLETLKNQQEAKEQAQKSAQEAKEQAQKNQEELKENIRTLEGKLAVQTQQLQLLVGAQRKKDEEERAKEERRLLRASRTRKPARDAASKPELLKAWEVIDQSRSTPFAKARLKVVALILFISAERISNLLMLTANHLNQLLDTSSQYITLPRIKSKETKYRVITLSQHVRALIEQREEDIKKLVEGKQGDDRVITAPGTAKPLGTRYLNQQMNHVLEKVGKILHKKLSSHSFRIGLITSIIETSGITAAQAFVGHVNISTTNVYNRQGFGIDKMQAIADKALTYGEERITKVYKKRRKKSKNNPAKN